MKARKPSEKKKKSGSKTQDNAGVLAVFYAYLLSWLAYMSKMLSAKPALPSTTKPSKKVSVTRVALERTQSAPAPINKEKKAKKSASQETLKEEAPVPPLLKFTIFPVDLPKPKAAVKLADKPKSKSAMPLAAPPPKEEEKGEDAVQRSIQRSINLTLIAEKTHRTIMASSFDECGESKLGLLAVQMAFLYRFHLLNLALKDLMKQGGSSNMMSYDLRTTLVHNLKSILLNERMLQESKRDLDKLDLTELNELSFEKRNIDAYDIAEHLQALPLAQEIYQAAKSNEEVDPDSVDAWLQECAIPLMNALSSQARRHADKRPIYNDAIRMLIIMMGEHCPKVDKLNPPVSDDPFTQFKIQCRLLRNTFAHTALTLRSNKELPAFTDKARDLSDNQMPREDIDLINLMMPPTRPKAGLAKLQGR